MYTQNLLVKNTNQGTPSIFSVLNKLLQKLFISKKYHYIISCRSLFTKELAKLVLHWNFTEVFSDQIREIFFVLLST